MKRAHILIGLMATLSLAALGQSQDIQPERAKSATKENSGSKNSGSGNSHNSDSLLKAGTMLDAQLQGMVDVRKSKVGDQVILKVTKSIKESGEVIVPKGTNLIGRITEVQQKTKDNATSRIAMVFDRIQGKDLDMPVTASIVSVLTANANAAVGDLFTSDVSGSSTSSGSAGTGGRSGGGGGLLGGVGSTVGGVVNTAASTVGSAANTATGTVASTTGTIDRTVNGLQISSSASGSASGSSTISARDKNVRIEKGATFQMRLDGSLQN